MFLVAKDRWGRVRRVHYLPEGIPLRAGAKHHRPDVVITEDPAFTHEILLKRDGDRVFIHLPNQVITVNAGKSVNLTNVILEFVPLFSYLPSLEELWRLESELFNPNLSENLRKFLRLYAAYVGLRVDERAPETLRDSVILLVSRLTRMPPEKIVADRKRVEKLLEAELKEVLAKMKPEELLHVFKIIAG
ncbi:MAG: hypothetical protein GXO00_02090 [Candidatus Diapherotrites archaeon]|nr:hypothetical protein [Candidatus Diapherotrites archaeon]